MTTASENGTVYDVAVIGAGPAGAQAAISAAHQARHVLVLDAGPISHLKGRAFWSKSVQIEDAPVFEGVIGSHFMRALREWMASRPVREVTIGGRTRRTGIEYRPGYVLKLQALDVEPTLFALETSVEPLRGERPSKHTRFQARTVVVASGFDDVWPDIEVNEQAERLYQRYQTVFRFAGNRRGWHVCIRCDGHLHIDEHLAILALGDDAFGAARGAQDFTNKITILTNGRPHGLQAEDVATVQAQGIEIVETQIAAHIGQRTDLLGFRFADGTERYFDGFLVDEGLIPNTRYLDGWDVQTDEEGLLIVNDDRQVLTAAGDPVPGLFAAGDIVSGERNLIATAFALGQDAGLSATDSLREW